ncbi:TetR/AcrR family transcriptional regulator [Stenotrophomonas sp. 24(2023)]|uniref:TetR/AcrR family transcriptional regulator n=1 Tax=Stenotrophomonas sp. 24(2023) TaxID=3068324 RepID=UPI0027DF44EE|nr:TetR/AcrR family transcriptional regulator [Stenotrophomonas sp. 24(2023)]WMJ68929.1 TetR/AcrR family transcriptional regulator [Stenotrophomonas sp. 24(2023)]
MPQVKKIDDAALLDRLALTFKDVGFEGASLAVISEATGLKKSSLYHRFPNGKEAMAQEVLANVSRTLEAEVFPALAGAGPAADKLARFVAAMDAQYDHGRQSCLLNMLTPPRGTHSGCGEAINGIFQRLQAALSQVARARGIEAARADLLAEQMLVEMHGALVVARGMDDPAVFQRAMARLPRIILDAPMD